MTAASTATDLPVRAVLGSALDPRANSLNALRLVLATTVIVSHSWALGGFGGAPRWGLYDPGDWAVVGFFAISGWLITGSRLASRPLDYLWRRVLRIYPAFLVCQLVVAFVLAPLAAGIGPGGYRVLDGVSYVLNDIALVMRQWEIGDTLASVPKPAQWAGSLWTLVYEVLCYVLVGVLVTLAGRRTPVAVVLAWLASTVAQVVVLTADIALPGTLAPLPRLAAFFFAGASLYVLRDRVPSTGPLAALAALAVVLSGWAGPAQVLVAVPVAYLCLWLGSAVPVTLGRRNDVSYGMYIYAWPVQQLLSLVGLHRHGFVAYVLLSIVLTAPLAVLSWFAVEKPAMRFRRLGSALDARLRSGAPARAG